MSTDPRIRVIKLAERKRRAKARVRQGSPRRPGRDEARGGAATVSGWVDELRRQKRQGAGALDDFNNLFEDPS